ncbi:MAG: outer membrane beta-barrel protein [Xanthobacteraceae bacterium]
MSELCIDRASEQSCARRFAVCCAIGLIAVFILSPRSAAQAQSSPDMAQMADMLKKLEARVDVLEAENQQSKKETAAARAEAQALREKIRTGKPAAIRVALAPANAAMAATASSKLYDTASPMVPVAQSWTGLYVGAAGGFGWMHSNETLSDNSTSSSTTVSPGPTTSVITSTDTGTASLSAQKPGVMASLFLGYNHMLNDTWVIGGELDGTLANTGVSLNGSGTSTFTTTSLTTPPGGAPAVTTSTGPSSAIDELDNRWLISALARVGFLVDPGDLVYVLGGYTYGRFELEQATTFGMNGGTVGVGWERQIVGGWNLRAEYRYTRFASTTVNVGESSSTSGTSAGPTTTTTSSTLNDAFHYSDVDMHSVWLGVSHSFGPFRERGAVAIAAVIGPM